MIEVLLITNKGDITTDFVVQNLKQRNVSFYRLNTEDLFLKVGVSLNFDAENFFLSDTENDLVIDLQKIKSVYYRRPVLPVINDLNLTSGEADFLFSEISFCVEGIYKTLKNAFWISPVTAIREAECKIYQLQVAKEIGFMVPPSLITSQPKIAEHFLSRHQSVVKPIKTGLIKDKKKEKVIFTTLFNEIEKLERIKNFPTYFQKFIDKTADIRVTVIGMKIFPALILSQEFSETKVDWRQAEHIKLEYKRIELPSEVSQMCLQLVERLGLNFGAIDLVLDAKGDYHFLEINPNGQWAWIEKQLDYNLSSEIVNLLTEQINYD